MILVDPDLEPDPELKAASATRRSARDSQKTPIDIRLPSARSLARFLKAAQEAVRLKGQVTVLLTTDAAIRDLNRRFRGKNKATDVLSFPAEVLIPGSSAEGIAGDIAISVTTALRQAAEQGHSLATEIKVLILHGVLHLAGFDHEADAGQMARRERVLRGKLGLPLGLIERAGKRKSHQGLKPGTSFGRSSARLKSCPFMESEPRAKAKATAKGDARTSGAKARKNSKQASRGLKTPAPSDESAAGSNKGGASSNKGADFVRGSRA